MVDLIYQDGLFIIDISKKDRQATVSDGTHNFKAAPLAMAANKFLHFSL